VRRILFVIFIFNFSIIGLEAQKGWELGAWLGTSFYYGDLNTTTSIRKPGLALGIMGRYNFNTRITATGSINFGNIAGADSLSSNNFERNRNLSFKSRIYDVTGQLEFHFFEYDHWSKDYHWTPYTFIGFNFVKFNPRAELNGETYYLNPLGTEGQDAGNEYHLVSGGLVLGGGFKWDINRDWSVNIFFSTHRLLTDYLDDVSTTFAENQKILITRGPVAAQLADRSLIDGLGAEGKQRGNANDKDSYNFVGISIMKYFGDIDCPKISEPHF